MGQKGVEICLSFWCTRKMGFNLTVYNMSNKMCAIQKHLKFGMVRYFQSLFPSFSHSFIVAIMEERNRTENNENTQKSVHLTNIKKNTLFNLEKNDDV